MTATHARVIALAAGLVCISALVPDARLHTQPTPDEQRALAERGDAGTQFGAGYRYWVGQGAPQDDAEAVRWYRLAADQGNAGAQVSLGFMYAKRVLDEQRALAESGGSGAQPDLGYRDWVGDGPQEDARFRRGVMNRYRLEAEQGHAAAQFYVGGIYRRGQGVPQDHAEAARWFRPAADQGHGDAQFALGGMHSSGLGVSQDDVEAHIWFNLAARSYRGEEDRDRSARARDAVAAHMTADQIARAQRRAREWMPTPEQVRLAY